MTYHHKTVWNLIKLGRTEPRSRGWQGFDALGECACTGPAGAAAGRPLGGIPLGPLSGHPVVLCSVGHVLCGNAAHQGVGCKGSKVSGQWVPAPLSPLSQGRASRKFNEARSSHSSWNITMAEPVACPKTMFHTKCPKSHLCFTDTFYHVCWQVLFPVPIPLSSCRYFTEKMQVGRGRRPPGSGFVGGDLLGRGSDILDSSFI